MLPKVSVVIPVYNQAEFVGDAICSVLSQTFANFEVLVVDDGSSDDIAGVLSRFHDERIRLLRHGRNRGLPAARNTGMRAARGELIALLDADDLFHPDKLQVHVDYMEAHPEIGVTYCGRFELNHSSTTVRELYRPPQEVTLRDFVILGFPFAPSDMVIRREWAQRVHFFDECYVHGGEDLEFPCRLALQGCRFQSVHRLLNYRRYHARRYRRDLAARLQDVTNALERTFADPRCPESVRHLRTQAYTHHYLVLSFHAFAQERREEGVRYLQSALRSSPHLLARPADGLLNPLWQFFMLESIADETMDHEELLLRIHGQFPAELDHLVDQRDTAIGLGYTLKGARAAFWERGYTAREHGESACRRGSPIDMVLLRRLANQLAIAADEFGADFAVEILQRLVRFFIELQRPDAAKKLAGLFYFNQAFIHFHSGALQRVLGCMAQAIRNEPQYLCNRGTWSITLRSLLGRRRRGLPQGNALRRPPGRRFTVPEALCTSSSRREVSKS